MSKFSLGFFLIFISISFVSVVNGSAVIDKSVEIKSVIDGISFKTTSEDIFKLADVETRCADWDNSTGLISPKSFLASLIFGKTGYLDIDSQYTFDNAGNYNRTDCVIYTVYNSTHYLNINQVMVEHGLVLINNHENDFNPDIWTRYVRKQAISEFPSLIIIPILASATLFFFISTKILKEGRNSF